MKNKLWFSLAVLLMVIPLVSAAEVFAALDLWYLLVENVFGSVLFAGIGIIIGMLLIGMVSKMSPTTLQWLIIFFAVVYSSGYSVIVPMLAFVIAFILFAASLINLLNSYR